MSWLQPKLHLKVAQKQILTPGLVQMVSVLALNRLELREMINQEMVANPMLEELTDESPPPSEDYSEETFLKAETEKVPETEPANPFDEFDVASFFNQYLDSGGGNGTRRARSHREAVVRQVYLLASGLDRTSDLAVERDGLQRNGARNRRSDHRQPR